MTAPLMPFVEFVEKRFRMTMTPAQRVFCRVAFDDVEFSDLSASDHALAVELFGDIDAVPDVARRIVVLKKGARVGGTRLSAYALVRAAITAPLALAHGERAVALIVAPDKRLAHQALRYARGAVELVPEFEKRVVEDGADGFVIQRPDGARVAIECLPATRGGSAVRGRSLVAAHMSEAAFFRDSESVVNDADVFSAINPRLMPGAKLILESTPWAAGGLLHSLFEKNFGAPKGALVANAPTLLMRPDEVTRQIVAEEYERDPENAAREFGAEFMAAGSGLFFDASVIDARVNAALTGESPLPQDARWVTSAGSDFAFVRDSSALVVCAFNGRKIVVMRVIEQRPQPGAPLKPSAVVGAFASEARAYGANGVHADGHYKESIREHLDAAKLEIFPGPEGQSGKAASYIHFRHLLNENEIELPNHPRLLAQLKAIISRPAPGGGLTISSPRGKSGHGDIVSALILAAWGLRHINQPQERLITGRSSTRGGLTGRRR